MQQSPPVVVYADVVCDLFHAGHVRFFELARALGDRLIVGMMADDDVATYKPRPVLTLAERATVVAACRLVDRVIAPAPLHCTARFLDEIGAAFCVHGDDMRDDELMYFYRDLIEHGRLRKVPYTQGISSRAIVARIAGRLAAGTLRT
ncbi:MAG: adenylyltransferase/cytidyltransferase family protein [Alphaproteobacteria bacterium]|nr:adenylyltransferase/cytidyltransferase family protein [Alphaproteobacteria bacterium]